MRHVYWEINLVKIRKCSGTMMLAGKRNIPKRTAMQREDLCSRRAADHEVGMPPAPGEGRRSETQLHSIPKTVIQPETESRSWSSRCRTSQCVARKG